jgi:hypothetical protein
LKINLKQVSYFLAVNDVVPFVHVYHAIHHNFTTKNHVPAHHISQNTPKKPLKTPKNTLHHHQNFSCKKTGLGLENGLEKHTSKDDPRSGTGGR